MLTTGNLVRKVYLDNRSLHTWHFDLPKSETEEATKILKVFIKINKEDFKIMKDLETFKNIFLYIKSDTEFIKK